MIHFRKLTELRCLKTQCVPMSWKDFTSTTNRGSISTLKVMLQNIKNLISQYLCSNISVTTVRNVRKLERRICILILEIKRLLVSVLMASSPFHLTGGRTFHGIFLCY